jgi:hypothetical protein
LFDHYTREALAAKTRGSVSAQDVIDAIDLLNGLSSGLPPDS